MRELRVDLPTGVDPRVGELLWQLGDTRRRTLETLAHVSDDLVDRAPATGSNTIGTLLYHVAAIELDWLYADILGEPFPDDAAAWFPADVRDTDGRLAAVADPLDRHLARLAWVRSLVVERVGRLTPADLDSPRENDGVTSTPAWVLHHLSQHEAEHRGHIQALLTGFGVTDDW